MRWPLTFALALAASTAALSYISFSHSFQEYEQAQVLVVGRVIEIQLGSAVNEQDVSTNREVRYLASEMVRANHTELLQAAMARALEVADDPSGDDRELQVAGRFVSEQGSEAELKIYASLVRKHRDSDPLFYNRLWQSVGLEDKASAGYVLAVVLEDRRIAFRDVRYADLAAGALQRQTGEDFGAEPDAPLFARDRAIDRALAWLAEHGYTQP